MRPIMLLIIWVLSLCVSAKAEELVYRGKWNTTNRKLDGSMTCIVDRTAVDSWEGRFFGEWQGVKFDYRVAFTGSPDDLIGSATIDGAAYQWRGLMTPEIFKANFTGDRYRGSFELQRVDASVPDR